MIRQPREFREHVRKMFDGYATADPMAAHGVVRANTRLVDDCRSEAQLDGHTVICDEPKDRGGTDQGPSPLQYFLASLRF